MVRRHTNQVIMVLGVHRSGTSCLAGMLAALGLPMGNSGIRANAGNPKGFFEDKLLRRVMFRCGHVEFPGKEFSVPPFRRVQLLRQWRRQRSGDGPLIGAKLPAMGNMVPEMHRAFGGHWKVIVTTRPFLDSAKSLQKRHGAKKPLEVLAALFQRLAYRRDAALSECGAPVLRIVFADLMGKPEQVVAQLIDFCGLSPTAEQRAQAIAFVEPKLNHFTEIP